MADAKPGERYQHPLAPNPICVVEGVMGSLVRVTWENGTTGILSGPDLCAIGYALLRPTPDRET